MVKITVMPHVLYKDGGEEKGFGVIRDNGKCLYHDQSELACLLEAWKLVCEYGLVLVEPW